MKSPELLIRYEFENWFNGIPSSATFSRFSSRLGICPEITKWIDIDLHPLQSHEYDWMYVVVSNDVDDWKDIKLAWCRQYESNGQKAERMTIDSGEYEHGYSPELRSSWEDDIKYRIHKCQ